MAEEKPKLGYCPNCGDPAIRTGNEIACGRCDTIFIVNEKGEAKVKTIGIEDRLKKLEDTVFKAEKPDKQEPESQPDDQDKPKEGENW